MLPPPSPVLLSLSVMVSIGFHTEWSALVLAVVLTLSAIWMYPFWAVHERLVDYYKCVTAAPLSPLARALCPLPPTLLRPLVALTHPPLHPVLFSHGPGIISSRRSP